MCVIKREPIRLYLIKYLFQTGTNSVPALTFSCSARGTRHRNYNFTGSPAAECIRGRALPPRRPTSRHEGSNLVRGGWREPRGARAQWSRGRCTLHNFTTPASDAFLPQYRFNWLSLRIYLSRDTFNSYRAREHREPRSRRTTAAAIVAHSGRCYR
jgi:hypothetical protein